MSNANCPNCGHPNQLAAGAQQDQARCSQCGHPLKAGEPRYYIAQGENVQGPYPLTRVRELIQQGHVRSSMNFSMEGGPWLPGSRAPELFPQAPASPPLPPAPGGPPPPGYAAPPPEPHFEEEPRPRARRRMAAHRGSTVLTLGILGVLCCGILGIIAWVMGNEDLAKMRRGDMDPSGKGTTEAGRILGIIAVVLMGIGIIAYIATGGAVYRDTFN